MVEETRKSRLFTLPIWREEAGEGTAEWRGKVQALPQGDACYFRNWPGLIRYLEAMSGTADNEASNTVRSLPTTGGYDVN